MRIMKTVVIGAALLALPLSFAFAGGAGGVTWSDQRTLPPLSNTGVGMSSVGGFGYGVTSAGQRTGGFGFALYSGSGTDSIAGGVGGIIVGQELRLGPITAALDLWTGLGGISATYQGVESGYCILFGEADVELGAAVTPWMQLVLYGGIQGFADLTPGSGIGARLTRYAPVIGMRMAWGSFGSR